MAINIEMPKLSDTMTEGTLVKWNKKIGDEVEIGDILAEVETDKATMEMEAFDDGFITKILIAEGEKAPVGATLAILSEDASDTEADSSSSASAPVVATPQATTPSEVTSANTVSSSAPTSANGQRVKASPLARKIADSEGIDLSSIQGSGPDGRIVKKDLTATVSVKSTPAPVASSPAPVKTATPAAATPAPVATAIQASFSGEDQVTPLSSMRKIIADRLLTSKQTIPHFYLHVEADAAPMMSLRKQINAQAEATHGNKYTVNDFIVKALINATLAVPAVNASFNGDSIVQFASVGVSVAIAVEDGLVTPVVKNAETKSLLQISREIKDLAVRSRDKKLKPNEFDGGTITISNLGSYGIDSFDAIVNPPQAAILSVGGISEKAVVKDGQIVPGLRMNLGISCDHRVVDGAVAAQFLSEIKKLIENPALMLV